MFWYDLVCSVSTSYGGCVLVLYVSMVMALKNSGVCKFSPGKYSCGTFAFVHLPVINYALQNLSVKQQPRWRGSSVEIPSSALMNWTRSSPTLTLVLALAHAVSTKKDKVPLLLAPFTSQLF